MQTQSRLVGIFNEIESFMSSVEKYKIDFVEHYLREFVNQNYTILEIGCGMGQYRDCTPAHYVGLDVTSAPYKENCPRKVDVVATATDLPAPAECYHVVFAVGALYQMPDPLRVLSECYRILKPGGRVLFFDYNRRTQKRLEGGERAKRPAWSQWRLKHLLQTSGFRNCQLLLPLCRKVREPRKTFRLFQEEILGHWAIVTGVR